MPAAIAALRAAVASRTALKPNIVCMRRQNSCVATDCGRSSGVAVHASVSQVELTFDEETDAEQGEDEAQDQHHRRNGFEHDRQRDLTRRGHAAPLIAQPFRKRL